MTEAKKKQLLAAIEGRDMEVTVYEPNNVREHQHKDGSTYYVVVGDDIKFGVDAGSCEVSVMGYTVTCDINNGTWSGDEELLEDEDIMEAISCAEGVVCGEMLDLEDQMLVYAMANDLCLNDLEYYWCEDPDCPHDDY